MLNSKIIKIIVVSVVAFIVLLATLFVINSIDVINTKNVDESLLDVEEVMGEDIVNDYQVIEEFLKRYNDKEDKYIYKNLMTERYTKNQNIEEFKKKYSKMYEIFGESVSHNLDKSEIKIRKSKKGKVSSMYLIPTEFENIPNGYVRIFMYSDRYEKPKINQVVFEIK